MSDQAEMRTAAPNIEEVEQIWVGRKILQALFGAVKAAMVYEANNRAYRQRAEELGERLKSYGERYGELRIDYFNDFFFIDGVRLRYGSADFSHDRELATLFEELELGQLKVSATPDRDQLDRMVFALAHIDRRLDDPFHALSSVWLELQLDNFSIKRMAPKIADRLSTDTEVLNVSHTRRQRAGSMFFRATELVREFARRTGETGTFNSAKGQRVVHDLIDHIVKDETSLLEFTAIKEFDDYTYAHSTNVCIYSIALGLRLGLDRRRLSQLGYGALFHDVGKVKLPAELINKPDEYDNEDWRAMQQHPALGALCLAAIPTIDEHHARAVLVAYEHHRSLDGRGYPSAAKPHEPNLFSKIVAIADSYDAMTSGRVYMKSRVSPDEGLQRLLEQGGTRYDLVLLRGFVHVLGVFPVGTFVRLNSGETGIVSANNPKDLYRPVVRILCEATEGPVAEREIHLAATDPETGKCRAYIAEVIAPEKTNLTMSEALGLPSQEPQPAEDAAAVK